MMAVSYTGSGDLTFFFEDEKPPTKKRFKILTQIALAVILLLILTAAIYAIANDVYQRKMSSTFESIEPMTHLIDSTEVNSNASDTAHSSFNGNQRTNSSELEWNIPDTLGTASIAIKSGFVPPSDYLFYCDPYVIVLIEKKSIYTTKTLRFTTSPVWNETVLTTLHTWQNINFLIYDKDSEHFVKSRDDFLGSVSATVYEILLAQRNATETRLFFKEKYWLNVALTWYPKHMF